MSLGVWRKAEFTGISVLAFDKTYVINQFSLSASEGALSNETGEVWTQSLYYRMVLVSNL